MLWVSGLRGFRPWGDLPVNKGYAQEQFRAYRNGSTEKMVLNPKP